MERVSRHGALICQRSRDEHEQQLVSTTLANLTDQLQQVRSWLEEKKLQVIIGLQSQRRRLVSFNKDLAHPPPTSRLEYSQ